MEDKTKKAKAPVEPAPVDVVPGPLPEEDLRTLVADLKKIVDQQQETISDLSKAADRGRMETIKNRRKKIVDSTVNISLLNGLVVTGWRTVIDEVWKDENGVYHEDQMVELTTEDGATHPMKLVDRFRVIVKQPATIIERKRVTAEGEEDDDGNPLPLQEIMKLKLSDGREVELDSAFVN